MPVNEATKSGIKRLLVITDFKLAFKGNHVINIGTDSEIILYFNPSV